MEHPSSTLLGEKINNIGKRRHNNSKQKGDLNPCNVTSMLRKKEVGKRLGGRRGEKKPTCKPNPIVSSWLILDKARRALHFQECNWKLKKVVITYTWFLLRLWGPKMVRQEMGNKKWVTQGEKLM